MSTRLSWAARIERAKKSGHFTNADLDRACTWNQCAVGERRGFPPLEADIVGVLEQFAKTEEFRLGSEFGYAVSADQVEEAERIYTEIQALP